MLRNCKNIEDGMLDIKNTYKHAISNWKKYKKQVKYVKLK